jgi:hypothetical protein
MILAFFHQAALHSFRVARHSILETLPQGFGTLAGI